MHKFFVSMDNIYGDTAVITGEDVKHIYKVLRLEEGDRVNINNLAGIEYEGEVLSVDKKEVRVKLVERLLYNSESSLAVTLFQGLPKSSKMDLIVQKATELGINEITPIITERVVVKSELSEFHKTERWKRIALEACKQSKRTLIPEVNVPVEFNELLKRIENFDLVVVPYENQEGIGIRNVAAKVKGNIKTAAVIIGPEGGFEEEEIEALKEKGCFIITLGPRILRTETAGFVCVSLLQYEFGDMGGETGGSCCSEEDRNTRGME
jgi:16S rRNA (uracil1498-N3)-methyltransferase